jgi:hypothetical protein
MHHLHTHSGWKLEVYNFKLSFTIMFKLSGTCTRHAPPVCTTVTEMPRDVSSRKSGAALSRDVIAKATYWTPGSRIATSESSNGPSCECVTVTVGQRKAIGHEIT